MGTMKNMGKRRHLTIPPTKEIEAAALSYAKEHTDCDNCDDPCIRSKHYVPRPLCGDLIIPRRLECIVFTTQRNAFLDGARWFYSRLMASANQ